MEVIVIVVVAALWLVMRFVWAVQPPPPEEHYSYKAALDYAEFAVDEITRRTVLANTVGYILLFVGLPIYILYITGWL